MAEGERGGWLPPNRDDDDREQQGGVSSGDPLWSGRQPQQPEPAPRDELPGGWQPPTQTGWTPPPAGAQQGGRWEPPQQQPSYGPQASNGKATGSLICGIVGILFLPIIFSVAAIVLGYQARREIDASQGRQQNRGIATAGIITGWVGIAFGILLIVLIAAGVIAGLEGDTSEGGGDGFSEPAIALLNALPL